MIREVERMNGRRRRRLNLKIIGSNIAEATEQLARLLQRISPGELDEGELQVGLQHAYHHLNFAWNVRREPTSAYVALTQEQFEQWGKYPPDIDED
jgi:hypothetical protein